jgi:hypothetical protein
MSLLPYGTEAWFKLSSPTIPKPLNAKAGGECVSGVVAALPSMLAQDEEMEEALGEDIPGETGTDVKGPPRYSLALSRLGR